MTPSVRKWLSLTLMYAVPAIVFCFGYWRAHAATVRQQAAAEARLAAASDMARAVWAFVDSLDYAVVILDSDGKVVKWNGATALLTGYAEAEMIGGHVLPIVPPEMQSRHTEKFTAAMLDPQKVGVIQQVFCQVIPKDAEAPPIDVCIVLRIVENRAGEKWAIANIDEMDKINEVEAPKL